MPLGTRVGGPQRITWAPSLVRPQMFERATREWAMSPSRPTVRPSIRPLARRIVIRSSRPWVGCSWAPSPALMIEHLTCCASRWGVPGVGWRTTMTSAPIASMFLAVSMNDSPLERLEPLGGEVLRVGREPLGRQAEAGPRAGRVLEEQVEDDPALQARAPSCGCASRSRRTTRPCRGSPRSPRATGPPARAGACGSSGAAASRLVGQTARLVTARPPLGWWMARAHAGARSRRPRRPDRRAEPGPARDRRGRSSTLRARRHRAGSGARDGRGRPGPPAGRTPAGPGRRWRSGPRGRSGR